jgi:hypothetical protein
MNDRTTFIGLAFGVAILVAAGIGFSFYEHEHQGPAERIGEAIDDAAGK